MSSFADFRDKAMSERELPRLDYVGDIIVGVVSNCDCPPIEPPPGAAGPCMIGPPHESHDVIPPIVEDDLPPGVRWEDWRAWCRMWAAAPALLQACMAGLVAIKALGGFGGGEVQALMEQAIAAAQGTAAGGPLR